MEKRSIGSIIKLSGNRDELQSIHYRGGGSLVKKIASDLRNAGVEPNELRAADLESIDEFHFRGREATLELLERMNLASDSKILDIGSGLGGVARTIAEEAGVYITGVDLTQEFCDAANAISAWVDLSSKTEFLHARVIVPWRRDLSFRSRSMQYGEVQCLCRKLSTPAINFAASP